MEKVNHCKSQVLSTMVQLPRPSWLGCLSLVAMLMTSETNAIFCPQGYYNGTNSESGFLEDCLPCPSGTNSTPELDDSELDDRCDQCNPGYFDFDLMEITCKSCGEWTPDVSDDKYVVDTGDFSERCSCPANTFYDNKNEKCSQCPENSVLTNGANAKAAVDDLCICYQSFYFEAALCKECPVGSGSANNETNNGQAIRCKECKPGYYGNGTDECSQCPVGSNTLATLGFGTGDLLTRCSECDAEYGNDDKGFCVPLSSLTKEGDDSAAAIGIGISLTFVIILGFFIFIVIWIRVKQKELPEWFPAREWLHSIVTGGERQEKTTQLPMDEIPGLSMSFDVQDLPKKFVEFSSNSDMEFAYQWDQLAPIGKDQQAIEYKKPENDGLNRYGNIFPYDRTRVPLTTGSHSYINANFIKGYSREKEYIATQGPLPKTQPDFWRMVWEQKSILIVMVTNEEEKRRIKCQRYWPQPGELKFGSFTVKMLGMEELPNYLVRSLSITDETGEQRLITHLQYTGWPDHGVPSNSDAILRFCRHSRGVVKTSTTPIIVHCSAGVGRSGTFITIDTKLQAIAANRRIDILNFVWSMRMSRIFMIQTEAQYIFVHKALVEALSTSNIPKASFNKRMKSAMKSGDLFDAQFEEVQVMSQMLPNSSTVGSMPALQSKNRFANILPFDNNRVFLGRNKSEKGYINASFIPGYRSSDRPYIAAAAPVNESVNDFWQMVCENNTNTIVCLTKLVEKNREKCIQYWPSEWKQVYGEVTVELMGEEEVGNDLVVRTLNVSRKEAEEGAYTNVQSLKTNTATTVRLFHYSGFPEDDAEDHSNQKSILALIRNVNTWVMSHEKNGTKPEHIVVHCSSGAGRTGVYVAVAESIERVDNGDSEVDIKQVFIKLRTHRPSMIQTVAQYKFVHMALVAHLEQQIKI